MGNERAVKLLSNLKPRLTEGGITGLVLLEEGLHSAELNSIIEYLCDGTILMRHQGRDRELMVSRMPMTPVERRWYAY